MRVPYSWLKEFLPDLPPPEDLEPILARLGLAVEAVHHIPAPPPGVVFGVVRAARPLPESALKVLEVDVGTRQVTMVSGAPNAREGIGVAAALPGTVLPDGTELAERRIRGVASYGMALSPLEMGVGSYGGGLLELPADALEPGTPLLQAWPEEWVLELELTPNRADAASVLGVARDLAAALGLSLVLPEPEVRAEEIEFPVAVTVEDARGCDRYVARYARGLKIGPSPLGAQRRLLAAGLRPINNVVDATNYVMLELGNPLHAFDRRAVGEGIVVRRAREGEALVTLDGERRALEAEDLVIAARAGGASTPIGIAGVMGGANSEVRPDTTEIILEVAHFDPVSIRRTARRLGLATDASYRFERGVDPNLPPLAAERFLELAQQWAGAEVAAVGVDVGGPKPRASVAFRPSYANRLLGTDWAEEAQLEVLRRLGCEVEGQAEPYTVRPPTWRQDLAIEEDLVEEVARLVGYDAIPEALPEFFPAPDNRGAEAPFLEKARLREVLAGLGFQEVVNYAWVDPGDLARARAPEPVLRLKNPLDAQKDALRTALYPGLLRTVEANRAERNLLLFEVGNVFLEEEETHLALVLVGPAIPPVWSAGFGEGFYALKGLLEAAATRLGAAIQVHPHSHAHLHPGISGTVLWNGAEVGWIGQIHPEITAALELPSVFAAELKLPLPRAERPFTDLPRFPAALRDLAVVVPEAVPYHEVATLLKDAAGAYLEGLEVFDVYRGAPLPAGQKSLAFHLSFRHPERTLRDEEVDAFMERIIQAVRDAGYDIRG
ncbi:phenylalanine--tRNA ligase subunit beta [Marinithermus hydrothermalis]|uniref:Phenylalanine--tRNA ligase beta subunit n=1 Tax=Marinithermus hydrothermalis (strain DSM 14884 / JCM 11576 / T1) TaxID=869210 RepID=F2NPL5_MARHT|nr:phenylalanine--tRNA ligase subunit beta [Marinithermus hydrothermalis]AEB12516.1 Phenylalanyl-tRNA synthetase beta chain [Marinithermus hydrothermalis DSM 14884]